MFGFVREIQQLMAQIRRCTEWLKRPVHEALIFLTFKLILSSETTVIICAALEIIYILELFLDNRAKIFEML